MSSALRDVLCACYESGGTDEATGSQLAPKMQVLFQQSTMCCHLASEKSTRKSYNFMSGCQMVRCIHPEQGELAVERDLLPLSACAQAPVDAAAAISQQLVARVKQSLERRAAKEGDFEGEGAWDEEDSDLLEEQIAPEEVRSVYTSSTAAPMCNHDSHLRQGLIYCLER